MFKKTLASFFIIFLITSSFGGTVSAQEKIEVDFFFSPTCPHCAEEKVFLAELGEKYPDIEINQWNVFEKETINLLEEFYQNYKVTISEQGLVPITFIGEKYIVGYTDNQTTGKIIENYVLELKEKIESPTSGSEEENKIKIPIFGEINFSNFSPLFLSIVLGGLDGFNACAMIALGFLLAVLVATGLRKRVLLIGGTFILVSGIVYFIFISTWLNLFLVLPQIKLITYIVGAVIIIFAVFLLKDYIYGIVCKVCEIKPRGIMGAIGKFEKKLFLKMEELSMSKMSLPLVLLGVGAVAAGINLVELVCSLGFPLAFTKVLTSLELSKLNYYFYLLIYVIFYMIDDFIIFLLALFTLKITGFSQNYLKTVKLVSGVLLLILGFLIIFAPGVLAFG